MGRVGHGQTLLNTFWILVQHCWSKWRWELPIEIIDEYQIPNPSQKTGKPPKGATHSALCIWLIEYFQGKLCNWSAGSNSHFLCQFQPSGSLINRVFGLIFHLYLDFFTDHIFPIQISEKYSKCSNALIAVWQGSRHTWQTLPALTVLSVLWSLKPSYALATWAGCIWSHFFGKPWKIQRQNYKLFLL